MRFSLIDRIVDLEPGKAITAHKNLTLAEEYLADHFPNAPVMPGVMMLETLIQAGAWLVRVTDDFAHSLVLLEDARGIKYANFVEPGQTLRIEASIVSREGASTKLKAQGTVDDKVAVSGRLVLHSSNLADSDPQLAARDEFMKHSLRQLYAILRQSPEQA